MKKLLITGTAGFIGFHAVNKLIEKNGISKRTKKRNNVLSNTG